MIQDIFPSKMNITYSQKSASSNSRIMTFKDGKILAKFEEGKLDFPKFSELKCNAFYLFSIDEDDFFLTLENLNAELKGFEYSYLRDLRNLPLSSTRELFAAFTAFHLFVWYDTNRFCGKCGTQMVCDTIERAMVCPKCGTKFYPRINPAVIVGILHDGKILVTRYRTGYTHNSLVAGFCEIGETLEDTVRREVMEEVGLKVKNIRYYKSQPWGLAQDLLTGFFCELDGSDEITMDQNELKYAAWLTPDEIDLRPNEISLTNEMMGVFKNGQM